MTYYFSHPAEDGFCRVSFDGGDVARIRFANGYEYDTTAKAGFKMTRALKLDGWRFDRELKARHDAIVAEIEEGRAAIGL